MGVCAPLDNRVIEMVLCEAFAISRFSLTEWNMVIWLIHTKDNNYKVILCE